MAKKTILAIVCPCFNEEEIIEDSARELIKKLKALEEKDLISDESYIYYVNDGSKDSTWKLLKKISDSSDQVKALNLAKNVGHQNAIWAGMVQNKDRTDAIITMDSDLQDDLDVIDKFLEAFHDGHDICYGVKEERQADTLFKSFSAKLFYKIMASLGVELIYNHADFRLISAKVAKNLVQFNEYNLFLRGIFPLMGFKFKKIHYNIKDRIGGDSKYTFMKMLKLAINGITSFSDRPLYYVFLLGTLVSGFAFVMILYALLVTMFGQTVPGWASTIIPTYLLGGIQLLCLGIIGIYVGKIFMETKSRPRFLVDEELN
ncbi:MAG: glycosyltransferase family 2 protein [Bacteriovoracaceae bacterium]